jgi:ferredoxin
MKVSITDECVGCEVCTEICPEVFEMDNMKAVVKVDEVPNEYEEKVKTCIESCPVEAIIEI